jgi:hypothetical protein
MDPNDALEHWRTGRYITSHELAAALARAVDQRDAARSERDSWAVVASVADLEVS